MKHPGCVTDELWCSNLIRICPSFTPQVTDKINEKEEIRKLIEIMAEADGRQCDATYELIVTKDVGSRCDLTYRVIVKKEPVACKIAAIISVIAEKCPIHISFKVTPMECAANLQFLAEKLECKELPKAYVEAIQCGISPNDYCRPDHLRGGSEDERTSSNRFGLWERNRDHRRMHTL